MYFIKVPYSNSYVSIALFYFYNINILTYKNTLHFNYNNIKHFTSASNNDFSLIFHCFFDTIGLTRCLNYNYDTNTIDTVWTLN